MSVGGDEYKFLARGFHSIVKSLKYTHAFVTICAVMMTVVRVEFHISATIERVESTEQTLERVSLEEWMILGDARHVYGKLIVCNKKIRKISIILIVLLLIQLFSGKF